MLRCIHEMHIDLKSSHWVRNPQTHKKACFYCIKKMQQMRINLTKCCCLLMLMSEINVSTSAETRRVRLGRSHSGHKGALTATAAVAVSVWRAG